MRDVVPRRIQVDGEYAHVHWYNAGPFCHRCGKGGHSRPAAGPPLRADRRGPTPAPASGKAGTPRTRRPAPRREGRASPDQPKEGGRPERADTICPSGAEASKRRPGSRTQQSPSPTQDHQRGSRPQRRTEGAYQRRSTRYRSPGPHRRTRPGTRRVTTTPNSRGRNTGRYPPTLASRARGNGSGRRRQKHTTSARRPR